MKIRYPVIIEILMFIVMVTFRDVLPSELTDILGILFFVCLGLIIYLIIRNFFRIIINKKSEGPLKDKIDLIAKQLGIQYGTPEEKLEQLAILAAKGQKAESGTNP